MTKSAKNVKKVGSENYLSEARVFWALFGESWPSTPSFYQSMATGHAFYAKGFVLQHSSTA